MCENACLDSAFRDSVMFGMLALKLRICLKSHLVPPHTLFFFFLKKSISFLTVVHGLTHLLHFCGHSEQDHIVWSCASMDFFRAFLLPFLFLIDLLKLTIQQLLGHPAVTNPHIFSWQVDLDYSKHYSKHDIFPFFLACLLFCFMFNQIGGQGLG